MTRIAHLSDLHLIEADPRARSIAGRLRLSLLTLGRRPDPIDRARRATRALREAFEAKADHLVLTGDLTEDGTDEQLRELARILRSSPWPAHRITLVPGNHDAYADGGAWSRALAGPLASWAPTSEPGSVTRVGEASIVAVSTAFHQSIGRSAGRVAPSLMRRIADVVSDRSQRGRAVLLAQHHGPIDRGAAHWLDGLEEHDAQSALGRVHEELHVLCGHAHRVSDHALYPGGERRVFTAPAVVDAARPLRLYRVEGGCLVPDSTRIDGVTVARALARALLEDAAAC